MSVPDFIMNNLTRNNIINVKPENDTQSFVRALLFLDLICLKIFVKCNLNYFNRACLLAK